jgi:MprA protease rhombosortase-interaction domain-containing protein
VTKALFTINLSVSHANMLVGETIMLTATVPMDVTGTVTFTANGETLGTASIVNGVASMDATFGVAGDVEVVATSSGNANYTGATDTAYLHVHAPTDDVAPPTGNPTQTPTPDETPDPTPTPEVPTNPETPATGTPVAPPTSGLVETAPAGTTVIKVSNPGDFKVGDIIVINQGTPNEERRTIVAIDERGIVLNAGLDFAHDAGASVVLAAGSQPVVPPAAEPTGVPAAEQPGAPLPPASGTGLRIIETGPLFALPLVLAVLLLASGGLAYGTRRKG